MLGKGLRSPPVLSSTLVRPPAALAVSSITDFLTRFTRSICLRSGHHVRSSGTNTHAALLHLLQTRSPPPLIDVPPLSWAVKYSWCPRCRLHWILVTLQQQVAKLLFINYRHKQAHAHTQKTTKVKSRHANTSVTSWNKPSNTRCPLPRPSCLSLIKPLKRGWMDTEVHVPSQTLLLQILKVGKFQELYRIYDIFLAGYNHHNRNWLW